MQQSDVQPNESVKPDAGGAAKSVETLDGIFLDGRLIGAVNYASQQNRLPILPEISVVNNTDAPICDVTLSIQSAPEILTPFETKLPQIPARERLTLQNVPLCANAAYLCGLTERVTGRIDVRLLQNDRVLAEHTEELTALAYDQWQGSLFFPDLLTAFVTPNHPQTAQIISRAASQLEKWGDEPVFSAYQSRNPQKVLRQAAAVYAAIQELNVVYCVAPASFEAIGQRVRLCDAVVSQKLGNCLDLTLLYAACLEAIGLHPLLVLVPGHIFTGVWLENQMFPESVQDDASLLTKRLASGVGEIAVIETTCVAAGKSVDFDEACRSAEHTLQNGIDFFIDVCRARLSGVRPLPLRVMSADGWQIVRENRDEDDLTAAPEKRPDVILVDETVPESIGRVALWQRRLLDLSLRNTLLNLRVTKSVIPLLSDQLELLEDSLSDGEEYGVRPCPAELRASEIEKTETSARDPGLYAACSSQLQQPLLHAEFENHRLRAALVEAELTRAMTSLYRSARTALEENGANTLYLALGVLRWYESPQSERARYAPLVLLPIEIIRKSAKIGYVIRLRDEDTQINVTLLEMLKQNFGVRIGGLDPLPQDEHGVDLRAVFTVIRRAVMEQPRWDVVESAFIGLFSFSQFVMWNDIRNRMDDLRRNRIVKSLVDGKLSWEAKPMRLPEQVSPDGALLPIPADASQLFAIKQAAQDRSFVLHGPPGTGKSQTITALIANALAQGKTVLFVAEKMAALSVVQRRLDSIGIGAFCLSLHSNKSKKRDVLEQLAAAAEVAHGRPRQSWQEAADQCAALRSELDAYANALHKTRACGNSLFELVDRYETCRNASDAVRLPAEFAKNAAAASLSAQDALVGRLCACARDVGDPAAHPLFFVAQTQYDPTARDAVKAALEAMAAETSDLRSAANALCEALNETEVPEHAAQFPELGALAQKICEYLSLPEQWITSAQQEQTLQAVDTYALREQKCAALSAELGARWKESFLTIDANALSASWNAAALQWFLPRALAQKRMEKLLAPHAKGKIDRNALASDLSLCCAYQKERDEASRLQLSAAPALLGVTGGFERLREMVERTRLLANAIRAAAPQAAFADHAAISRARALCENYLNKMQSAGKSYESLRARLALKAECADMSAVDFQNACALAATQLPALRAWCAWNAVCEQARGAGMSPLVDAMERGALTADDAPDAWRRAVCVCLIGDIVASESALSEFTGTIFDEKIAQFAALDRQLRELSRSEIFCRLASRVPDFTRAAATSSEVGILQRAIRSGGRGVSIRNLFEQLPTLLPRLCPCMLMSPISAAQYLDPHRAPFDLVVFDEASQIPTCKAVGALARGKNAVIVGDPKQMPPTSFFAAASYSDDDAPEEADLESILDDCLALNLPQSHLLWHYRSRHESLIAFSNREFYENRLYTFPSVNDRERKVRLVSVDGFFDRGKTRHNRAEAEAVIRELRRRAHDPAQSGMSVGVVTFNISQQNLIGDLLDEACKNDAALETWAFHSEEPLFIKNLENVQGDERDAILFSIGYGPDRDGRVSMNFGPLNRDGGWRRLNVAVSRARREMIVFSALSPDQIDLGRTRAQGVAALRDFLRYAKDGTLPDAVRGDDKAAETQSGIADDICRALEEKGWACVRSVGRSRFRIDAAVCDPERGGEYLLGILLDGESYRIAQSARDRELAQCDVLRGLSWQLHRVWTMDYLDDPQGQIDRIDARLRGLLANRQNEPPAEAPPQDALCEDIIVSNDAENAAAPVYRAFEETLDALNAEQLLLPEHQKIVRECLSRILECEAPIREGLLLRRAAQAFGLSRAGSRIAEHLHQTLVFMDVKSTRQDEDIFYWLADQTPETYRGFRQSGEDACRRDARDIPVQEAANAVREVLRSQLALPREDLVREAARLLGYTRLGPALRTLLERGIDYALQNGSIAQPKPDYYADVPEN